MPNPPSNDATGGSPTGIVTLLYMDIEGSSTLWERFHDAMPHVLARCAEIVNSIVQAHNGKVFHTVVGGTSASFATASNAVAAAIDIRRAIAREDWAIKEPLPVRIALHTGELKRQEGMSLSTDHHRATNILDTAQGGQIVLSKETYNLVYNPVSNAFNLKELGSYPQQDLEYTETIYLLENAIEVEHNPLIFSRAPSHNLPTPSTTFVGREKDREQATNFLHSSKMLTIVGTAGCGKTRLALQVAYDVLEDFVDGVWFVDLAPLSVPELVIPRVASTLGIDERGEGSLSDRLVERLKDKHLLFVLDNCEHLKSACADLAKLLLGACPQLRLLATSREALGVTIETAWRLQPLSCPSSDQVNTEDISSRYEAIKLFTERATAAAPWFQLTDQNVNSVIHVCRRLDGIPLAIELAAACLRERNMSMAQLASGLDDLFRTLTVDREKPVPQQQTLRAAFDWSYDLLADEELVLLRRLSIFRGGWTLESAEQICAGGILQAGEIQREIHPDKVIDILTRLVDKSLVTSKRQGEQTRFLLLESMRQYCSEKLTKSGEAGILRERHLDWYLRQAEKAELGQHRPDEEYWLDYCDVENDNFRAALEIAEPRIRLRLVAAFWNYWYVRGRLTEGRSWLDRALSHKSIQPDTLKAAALNGAGTIAITMGDFDAAFSYYKESLDIGHQLGDNDRVEISLSNLALVEYNRGNFEDAKTAYETCLSRYRERKDTRRIILMLQNLAAITIDQEDYPVANAYLEEALSLQEAGGNKRLYAHTLFNIGYVGLMQHNVEEAMIKLKESLQMSWQLKDQMHIPAALSLFASIAIIKQHFKRAAVLSGAGDRGRKDAGLALRDKELRTYESELTILKENLDPDDFNAEYLYGYNMTLEHAVEYALSEKDAN
jgi:predicted ATPase/class 3 adenylate cyclase